ncbi:MULTISPECIES: hypothetical protein [Methylobacterium]|uniref:hypothetical protein n=1 Tax=Methylobacterium TaxID=407 RepID=UPI0011CCB9C7|nr:MULTISPECIES: hypothetical protein [Methylobacterium]TXN20507.1 hypothetical protein FV217_17670 [Methylobacterium sp. WL9]
MPPSGPSGPVSEVEAAYVRALVDHAEQRGRVPVLTETRSLGRVAGLKAAAPGLHVVLYRNLYQQWCSYTEQATCGNAYFLDTITKTARLSLHDPMIRNLLSIYPVETPSTTDMNTFYLFMFLHIYLYSHATAAADLVIDVNRLSGDAAYRGEIEGAFAERDVPVDFSDARSSTAYSLVSFPCRADMLEQIRIVGDAIIGKMASERGRAITETIVADLFEEHERHEFYSKRLRSVLLSTRHDRDAALAAAEAVHGQIAGLQDERDRSEIERDAALAAVEDARGQIAGLQGEREQSAIERDAALAVADEARRQADGLQGERDRSGIERDAARAAAEDAHRATDAMRAECDRLRDEANAASRAAEEIRHEADALRSERDAAVRDRAAIESEHGRLGRDLASLSALRDRLAGERDAALAAHANAERERQGARSRYDELLRWSLAFHDSTAASVSWRLTRPLRWIGLGRPTRPRKPDFL